MLRHFRDRAWHSTTWRQFAVQAASAARRLRAAGVSAVGPGADRLREPAGISHPRNRADGHPRRASAHLHHQHHGGPRAYPARLRGQRCGGVQRRFGAARGRRRQARPAHHNGAVRGDRGDDAAVERVSWPTRRGDLEDIAAETAEIPGRTGLPDLHVGHRRRAARRDAVASRHPVELPGRVHSRAAAAAGAGNLSLLPAALAQLRAHGRAVLLPQHWHRGGVFPRRRASRGGHAGRAADHPDHGATHSRRDPWPHRKPGGAGEGVEALVVRPCRRGRPAPRHGPTVGPSGPTARPIAGTAGARGRSEHVSAAGCGQPCPAGRGWSRR